MTLKYLKVAYKGLYKKYFKGNFQIYQHFFHQSKKMYKIKDSSFKKHYWGYDFN